MELCSTERPGVPKQGSDADAGRGGWPSAEAREYWRGAAKKRVFGVLKVPTAPLADFRIRVHCDFSSLFRHFRCPKRHIRAPQKLDVSFFGSAAPVLSPV